MCIYFHIALRFAIKLVSLPIVQAVRNLTDNMQVNANSLQRDSTIEHTDRVTQHSAAKNIRAQDTRLHNSQQLAKITK